METVRQKCINDLVMYIKEMMNPATERPLWNTVVQGDITTCTALQCPAIGIDEGSEEIDYSLYPMVTKTLRVYLNFKVSRKTDENAYRVFNAYLGYLQKHLLDLQSCDNIIKRHNIAVREVTNGNDIVTQNDPFVMGELVLEIEYRHPQGEPYINTGKRVLNG